MKQETILVVGASGTVGSELVKNLKAQGLRVRTTTSRTPADSSAAQVDLASGKGIKQAFEDVDKAFLLSPPGYADQYAILSPLIQEAKRQGLKKVVLMTAMGSNAVDTNPFRKSEIELEKSGLTYNIVRPNWFLQNFNTFWVQGIREQRKIELPAGTALTSFIDARDISAVIAKLLMSNKFDNQAFDLSGPKGFTHQEVAEEISAAIGHKVVYEDIAPQILKDRLNSAGFPSAYVDVLIMIFGFLKEGYNARVTSSVKDILGREPRSLKEYVQTFKSAWV